MNADSSNGQDAEQSQLAAADGANAEVLTTELQGSKGERIAKALVKLEEKKKKRMARQEQVYSVIC